MSDRGLEAGGAIVSYDLCLHVFRGVGSQTFLFGFFFSVRTPTWSEDRPGHFPGGAEVVIMGFITFKTREIRNGIISALGNIRETYGLFLEISIIPGLGLRAALTNF